MKSFVVFFIFLILNSNLYSQNQNDSLIQLEFKTFYSVLQENDPEGSYRRLRVLDSLESDKITPLLYLVKNLSINSGKEGVRNAGIKFFLTLSRSKDSGVSLLAIKSLKNFHHTNFDEPDIDSICIFLEQYSTVYKETVELAGMLGNQLLLAKIREVFPNSRNFSKPEIWASYKALARLGDKDALDYCIKKIVALPVSDEVIDAIYPDLIYIHKKEAFDVLIKALHSDEKLCTSNNPNAEGKILCGYRIMELLAPEIVDFPVKILPSGDIDSEDYNKSLKKVRKWFMKNGNNYTIMNNN
ncbi:MAG: hypothetical protein AB9846_02345 [Tenuifilaceae bacterium]